MRWGGASLSTDSLRWVRPLHGSVALLGEEVVPVEIAGVRSGAATLGHRFHHPGQITIGSAADYEEKLRACHVIVDQDQRRAIIRGRVAEQAKKLEKIVFHEKLGTVADKVERVAKLARWLVEEGIVGNSSPLAGTGTGEAGGGGGTQAASPADTTRTPQ